MPAACKPVKSVAPKRDDDLSRRPAAAQERENRRVFSLGLGLPTGERNPAAACPACFCASFLLLLSLNPALEHSVTIPAPLAAPRCSAEEVTQAAAIETRLLLHSGGESIASSVTPSLARGGHHSADLLHETDCWDTHRRHTHCALPWRRYNSERRSERRQSITEHRPVRRR
jgi:hypothetical protein